MLHNKSHAYLISQNYGSSCSSFNGSSGLLRDRPLSSFSAEATVPFTGQKTEKKFIKARMKVSRGKRDRKMTLWKRRGKKCERNSRILPPSETPEISEFRETRRGFETAETHRRFLEHGIRSAPRSFIERSIKAAAGRLRYPRAARNRREVFVQVAPGKSDNK